MGGRAASGTSQVVVPQYSCFHKANACSSRRFFQDFKRDFGHLRSIRFAEGPLPTRESAPSPVRERAPGPEDPDEELARRLQLEMYDKSPSPPKRGHDGFAEGPRKKPTIHVKKVSAKSERLDSGVNVSVTEVPPASDLAGLQLDGVDQDAEEMGDDGAPLRRC